MPQTVVNVSGDDARLAVEQQAIERFTDALWMERGLSDNTLAAYRNDLAGLAAWLIRQDRGLLTARREDLLAYLSHRVALGARPRTTARLLSSMRRFYRHQVREGILQDDPSVRIDTPRIGRPLPDSLSEREVEDLLDAPDTDSVMGLRDRAMLELLYACGLRVSELVGLTREQLNLNQGVVRLLDELQVAGATCVEGVQLGFCSSQNLHQSAVLELQEQQGVRVDSILHTHERLLPQTP